MYKDLQIPMIYCVYIFTFIFWRSKVERICVQVVRRHVLPWHAPHTPRQHPCCWMTLCQQLIRGLAKPYSKSALDPTGSWKVHLAEIRPVHSTVLLANLTMCDSSLPQLKQAIVHFSWFKVITVSVTNNEKPVSLKLRNHECICTVTKESRSFDLFHMSRTSAYCKHSVALHCTLHRIDKSLS